MSDPVSPHCLLPREKAPKEKPNQPVFRHPRQGPTDEAQMAAAAALARLEQKQPRARGPMSQDSIRNQGELCSSSGHSRGRPERGRVRPLALCPRGQSMAVHGSQILCLALDENKYIANNFGGL